MANFGAGTQRTDPYKNFLFRVKMDNTYVLGVSKVSGLSRSIQVVKWRDGADPTPRMSPGQVTWSPITLERGITNDATFTTWANTVWSYSTTQGLIGQNAAPVALANFRKTIIIEVYDVGGTKVLSYNVYNAWVSEFRSLSDLDGEGNAVTVESLTLQNEGWNLDNGSP